MYKHMVLVPFVLSSLLLAGALHVAAQEKNADVIVIDRAQNGQRAEEAAEVPTTPTPSTPPCAAAVPVGTVVAWLKSLPNTPPLPAGWAECNGQTLDAPDSPYNGITLPSLNGTGKTPKRFLRGAPASGAAGGAETHDHGRARRQKYGRVRANSAQPTEAEHLPPFYEVVWIIRVK